MLNSHCNYKRNTTQLKTFLKELKNYLTETVLHQNIRKRLLRRNKVDNVLAYFATGHWHECI